MTWAAGMNSSAPVEASPRPMTTPPLYPRRLLMKEAGIARQKYAP